MGFSWPKFIWHFISFICVFEQGKASLDQLKSVALVFITDQIDKREHRASMERKGDNINISFSPVTPNTIRVQSEQVEVKSSDTTPPTSSDKPSFGSRPNTNAIDFDSQAEINCLLFK